SSSAWGTTSSRRRTRSTPPSSSGTSGTGCSWACELPHHLDAGALLLQGAEDDLRPPHGLGVEAAGGGDVGLVGRGRGGDGGGQGGLGGGELVGRLAEPATRARPDAVDADAQLDDVQVGLEDARLGDRLLEAPGEDRLEELAAQGALAAEVE